MGCSQCCESIIPRETDAPPAKYARTRTQSTLGGVELAMFRDETNTFNPGTGEESPNDADHRFSRAFMTKNPIIRKTMSLDRIWNPAPGEFDSDSSEDSPMLQPVDRLESLKPNFKRSRAQTNLEQSPPAQFKKKKKKPLIKKIKKKMSLRRKRKKQSAAEIIRFNAFDENVTRAGTDFEESDGDSDFDIMRSASAQPPSRDSMTARPFHKPVSAILQDPMGLTRSQTAHRKRAISKKKFHGIPIQIKRGDSLTHAIRMALSPDELKDRRSKLRHFQSPSSSSDSTDTDDIQSESEKDKGALQIDSGDDMPQTPLEMKQLKTEDLFSALTERTEKLTQMTGWLHKKKKQAKWKKFTRKYVILPRLCATHILYGPKEFTCKEPTSIRERRDKGFKIILVANIREIKTKFDSEKVHEGRFDIILKEGRVFNWRASSREEMAKWTDEIKLRMRQITAQNIFIQKKIAYN